MKRLVVGVTLCLLAVGAVATASPVVAQADYSLTVDNTVDVPTQNVTLGNDTFEVSSVAVVDPGETVQVRSSGPSEGYDLYLYNSEEQLANSTSVSGNATVDYNMSYAPGTYYLVLNVDGERERLQPVVVEGYDVSLSMPENATGGEPVNATVGVERRNGTEKDVESVEVVLWDDDYNRTVEADEVGEGQYDATVTVEEPGDYAAHAAVRGEQTIDGENELLALSGRHQVSVEVDGNDTTATEAAENGTATPAETTTAPPTTTEPAGEGGGAEPDDTETDDGIVTPAETTTMESEPADTETTSGDGPVGLPGMLSALAAALAALRLRRRG